MLDGNCRQADQKREQLLKLNEKVIISLLDATRFLARQSLDFQGHNNNPDLVVKHGSIISVEYVNCFGILQELYKFFSGSMKRHALLYKNLYETEYGLLIKDLSKTRWSDRYNSISAVLISYKEIVETLDDLSVNDQIRSDRCLICCRRWLA
ncbi:unnamed protein product [Didymodactylos carnosus]|uniref:Uncharacterized protein n=1 Tax=Didymodactylos carnosus TaxID=1234261 RepID=A0A815L4A3_9BILA|nr:unnamed protein product [Didymodactylos carnosus]CAF4292400.1 unnamed protein product [Didymodactylos carnosus]